MDRDFVERRESGFYLVGSRVPLDCIVRDYQKGEPPEAIRLHFPTLSLAQVYGAITYYLGHQSEVDSVMAEGERAEDAFHAAHPAPPHLTERMDRLRRQIPQRQP